MKNVGVVVALCKNASRPGKPSWLIGVPAWLRWAQADHVLVSMGCGHLPRLISPAKKHRRGVQQSVILGLTVWLTVSMADMIKAQYVRLPDCPQREIRTP